MRKVFRKIVIIVMSLVLLTGMAISLTGCAHSGQIIEVDGWTLFRFSRTTQWQRRGQVNILSADCESLVVEGVLEVPARIGRHDIHGFGTSGPMLGPATYFTVPSSVQRIVISAELHMRELFWGALPWEEFAGGLEAVEFLCGTFERTYTLGNIRWVSNALLVIPNGSTRNFTERLVHFYPQHASPYISVNDQLQSLTASLDPLPEYAHYEIQIKINFIEKSNFS